MISEGPSNPRVTIAVTRQLNQLKTKAPDGVRILINDADIFDIQAELEGPVQTPYEGGVFRCRLVLPADFPKCPPKGYFTTKIFHPNVSEKGEICVNTLKKDWNHTNWNFYNIFEVVKCLLIVPFPESALNEEAGKQFMEDYEGYFKHAKLMTDVHARPKIKHEVAHFDDPTQQSQSMSATKKDVTLASTTASIATHGNPIIPTSMTRPSSSGSNVHEKDPSNRIEQNRNNNMEQQFHHQQMLSTTAISSPIQVSTQVPSISSHLFQVPSQTSHQAFNNISSSPFKDGLKSMQQQSSQVPWNNNSNNSSMNASNTNNSSNNTNSNSNLPSSSSLSMTANNPSSFMKNQNQENLQYQSSSTSNSNSNLLAGVPTGQLNLSMNNNSSSSNLSNGNPNNSSNLSSGSSNTSGSGIVGNATGTGGNNSIFGNYANSNIILPIEEPLCVLSKNNGYFSSSTTASTAGALLNGGKQSQVQQFNNTNSSSSNGKSSNFHLHLTFNNFTVAPTQSTYVPVSNTKITSSNGQCDKKKWLKRI